MKFVRITFNSNSWLTHAHKKNILDWRIQDETFTKTSLVKFYDIAGLRERLEVD